MLRRTQGHTITADAATGQACTACGHHDTNLIPLPLPGFSDSPTQVCPDPVTCRRRAELAGVWKAA